MAGSKMEMPKHVQAQIDELEEIFTVKSDKLKAISEHFISELAKGMSPPQCVQPGCNF